MRKTKRKEENDETKVITTNTRTTTIEPRQGVEHEEKEYLITNLLTKFINCHNSSVINDGFVILVITHKFFYYQFTDKILMISNLSINSNYYFVILIG